MKSIAFGVFAICAIAALPALSQTPSRITFPSVSCIHDKAFDDNCTKLSVSAELFLPASKTQAVVIISHGSQGLDERHPAYAKHLVNNGMAALVVAHWQSRGITQSQRDFAANEKRGARAFNQALDALSAIEFLARSHPDLKKFGYLGESAGGTAALWTRRPYLYKVYKRVWGVESRVPDATVGLYSGCFERNSEDRFLPKPLLLISGELDNNTPAALCWRYADWINERGGQAEVIGLPGQHHDFDAPYPVRQSPNAENPSQCASLIDSALKKRIWEKTGEAFDLTAEGYRAFQRKCLDASKGIRVAGGNTGSMRTGYAEWTAFFRKYLLAP